MGRAGKVLRLVRVMRILRVFKVSLVNVSSERRMKPRVFNPGLISLCDISPACSPCWARCSRLTRSSASWCSWWRSLWSPSPGPNSKTQSPWTNLFLLASFTLLKRREVGNGAGPSWKVSGLVLWHLPGNNLQQNIVLTFPNNCQ